MQDKLKNIKTGKTGLSVDETRSTNVLGGFGSETRLQNKAVLNKILNDHSAPNKKKI